MGIIGKLLGSIVLLAVLGGGGVVVLAKQSPNMATA